MKCDADEHVVVRGIVTPHDWDEAGRIIAVALSAPEEEEYLIEKNTKGRELIQYVHENVRITGMLKKDARGGEILDVKEYEVIRYVDEPATTMA